MKMRAYVVILYGILLLIGGLMGFLKANSIISLIMGSTFALLAFISAYGMLNHKKNGFIGAVVVTNLLLLFFGYRYYLTQNFMPSGLMVIISAVVIVILMTKIGVKKTAR